ncbi:MAG: hypothetical protein KGJ43_02710, partial [Acidobacteriota bacterium]|nr:hypothetical protein [Acidobacteriota bacterium]
MAVLGLMCSSLAALSPPGAFARPVARFLRGAALPGLPAQRGLVPVLGSAAATRARERLVRGAFSAAQARAAARLLGLTPPGGTLVENEQPLPPCASAAEEELALSTHDVCYHGGPVLHDPTVHLIFWQGPPGLEHVSLFPPEYRKIIEQYFVGLAAESGHTSNVFAIDPQYFEVSE